MDKTIIAPQKADIIKDICLKLLEGNKAGCSDIANAQYPFSPFTSEKRKYTPTQMTKVFLRDGFIDRYFGEKLLFPGIFRILKLELPLDFPAHSNWKMTETHMVYWELFPTIDHILPIARGGKDIEENWVTTSMVRNSAKANWTLEEVGWTIKDKGNLEEWDGLSNLFLRIVGQSETLGADPYIRRWRAALQNAKS